MMIPVEAYVERLEKRIAKNEEEYGDRWATLEIKLEAMNAQLKDLQRTVFEMSLKNEI